MLYTFKNEFVAVCVSINGFPDILHNFKIHRQSKKSESLRKWHISTSLLHLQMKKHLYV